METRIVSCDCHILEPEDIYIRSKQHFGGRLRDLVPRIQSFTDGEQEYDRWVVEGVAYGRLGSSIARPGQRWEDPNQIQVEDKKESLSEYGSDPDLFIKGLEIDGVWGSLIFPTQGFFWYYLEDDELLSAVCRATNDYIAEFCKAYPGQLRGVGMINPDDTVEACRELERCATMDLAAAVLPVMPRPEHPYDHPLHERVWWTAQSLGMPLCFHEVAFRPGNPGVEFSRDALSVSASARCTTDHWMRYSLGHMLFSGVFERYPRLQFAVVEQEVAWIPYWLEYMDHFYERARFYFPVRFRDGKIPTDIWHSNMHAVFIQDSLTARLRDRIGVDNLMWGSDYVHSRSTWPKSIKILNELLEGVPDEERHKMTSGNAQKLFKFTA